MTQKQNPPDCKMHELLVSYLYGEAGREESAKFASHLQACASCQQELAAFEQVRDSLQHWQLDELPNLRVVVEQPPKSVLTLLKELFTAMPIWAKGLGTVAAAMLLFAILGCEI